MTQIQHRPDHHLKTAVADELAWTPSVNAEGIAVSVDGGAATLAGHVGTYPEKQAALRAATRVHGVTTTVDRILVRHGHAIPADVDLAREAMAVFDRRTVLVPKNSVQVDVRDQVITLRGSVDWHHEREAARRAVAALPGVSGVRNLITLRPRRESPRPRPKHGSSRRWPGTRPGPPSTSRSPSTTARSP
ncbi:BON domain-containing protein [Amycolatopsis sp. lyj-23]|uniref:BON domain-containing protein n=1 Tax=Amycolatopsis sp. lyj-23 TaxID=2789283 RepID=UPI00397D1C46